MRSSRFREWRLREGLTQAEVVAGSGVPQNTVSRVDRGFSCTLHTAALLVAYSAGALSFLDLIPDTKLRRRVERACQETHA